VGVFLQVDSILHHSRLNSASAISTSQQSTEMGEGGVDFQLLRRRRAAVHMAQLACFETRGDEGCRSHCMRVYAPKANRRHAACHGIRAVKCKQPKCNAVLNPYCHVDFVSKHWTCPFCLTRNVFPPHYAENITNKPVRGLSLSRLIKRIRPALPSSTAPAELIPQFTTLEYQVPGR